MYDVGLCVTWLDFAASRLYGVRGIVLVGPSAGMNWFVIQHTLTMRLPLLFFRATHRLSL